MGRFVSVDQCRGFTIVLMMFGNYAGKFAWLPWLVTHHRYGLSGAEVFAPVFVFLVGFGYRLSMLRRAAATSPAEARRKALRRYSAITGLGFLLYIDHLWDALTHIGTSGLISLPFIRRGQTARVAAALAYLVLFQFAYMRLGYGDWLMSFDKSLNGGPLGMLSWGFVLLMGTIAYDLVATRDHRTVVRGCLLWGVGLVLAGWLLTLEWPGLKDTWPYTRYGTTAPYSITCAGASFLIYLFFYVFCEIRGLRFPHFSAFGMNPIAMYILLGACVVSSKILFHFTGEPSPGWGFAGFFIIYALCYPIARYFEKRAMVFKF